jgi:hypothetical protein
MEEQVNIPALPLFSDGVTLLQALSVRMVMTFISFRFFPGKSRKNKSKRDEKVAASAKTDLRGEVTKKNF